MTSVVWRKKPFFHLAAPTVWDITPNITDDGTVLLDLSGSPDDIDDSFFIISANKTRENQDDEHHDDDDDNDDGRYLFMVNSSREIVEISGVPVFSNFTAIVYIVDTAHNIFKSEEFRFQTGEGSKWDVFIISCLSCKNDLYPFSKFSDLSV